MKCKNPTILIIVLALIFPSAAIARITWTAKVVKIEDCRTFQVEYHRQKIEVQLADITCSISSVQDGQEALELKKEILKGLKKLLLKKSLSLETVRRNNQLIFVHATLHGRDVGKKIIESGFAVVSANCCEKEYNKKREYHQAAIKAATQGAGLWKHPVQDLPVSFQDELFFPRSIGEN